MVVLTRLGGAVVAAIAAGLFQAGGVAAQGCVQAHTLLNYDAYSADQMKVYVNGQTVCKGGDSVGYSASDTQFCLRNHDGKATVPGCAPGYVLCTAGNGRRGTLYYYQNSILVWSKDLNMISDSLSHFQRFECYHTLGTRIWCQYALPIMNLLYYIESCIAAPDLTCSASQQKCKLCDYTGYCDQDTNNPPNPFPFAPNAAPQPSMFKAMFVDGSFTHGANGDYTWRYRLWEWPKTQNVTPEFVGLYVGTSGPALPRSAMPKPLHVLEDPAEPDSGVNDSGAYSEAVNPTFSWGHAASWGRQVAKSMNTIYGWVQTYQPDYLLGTITSMNRFVSKARRAKPNIKILLANVVHRTFIRDDLITDTNDYNSRLVTAIQGWNNAASPVNLVDVVYNYNCEPDNCQDEYDSLHPNKQGEFKFARAFSRVLVSYANISWRTPITPTGLTVWSQPEGLSASWTPNNQARGYEIRSRYGGLSEWSEPSHIGTWMSLRSWVLDGQTWEYQVRSSINVTTKPGWSGMVSGVAHLNTSTDPTTITSPLATGIRAQWSAVCAPYSLNRYEVLIYNLDVPGSWLQSYATRGTDLSITPILPLQKWAAYVVAWVSLSNGVVGGGVPKGATNVMPGSTRVPQISAGLTAVNVDATTVKLSWNTVVLALAGISSSLTTSITYLFPGAWNFEFCVSAFNGDTLQSAKLTCVLPAVYPGYETPAPPIGVAISNLSPTSIQLTWNAAPRATSYRVRVHNWETNTGLHGRWFDDRDDERIERQLSVADVVFLTTGCVV
ncbi:hypothetical protein B0H63DRAFT_534007 [Podospora didyma]|uniref:Carbohydrate Esterase Family 3 n=1 Tax=Podospora didyma TaxID=330526 RepID=A0AAE0P8I8_9PEZI|nr:hypothetical protein B0H63DRAFT_534007 [Podospora didyma]